MFSPGTKQYIATEVQKVLQTILDKELPEGEINFILHVDGAEGWSWANIRNTSGRNLPVPEELIQNLTVK
jgi:hypothetical protein